MTNQESKTNPGQSGQSDGQPLSAGENENQPEKLVHYLLPNNCGDGNGIRQPCNLPYTSLDDMSPNPSEVTCPECKIYLEKKGLIAGESQTKLVHYGLTGSNGDGARVPCNTPPQDIAARTGVPEDVTCPKCKIYLMKKGLIEPEPVCDIYLANDSAEQVVEQERLRREQGELLITLSDKQYQQLLKEVIPQVVVALEPVVVNRLLLKQQDGKVVLDDDQMRELEGAVIDCSVDMLTAQIRKQLLDAQQTTANRLGDMVDLLKKIYDQVELMFKDDEDD